MAKSSGVIRIDLTRPPTEEPVVESGPALVGASRRPSRVEILVAQDAASTTCDLLVQKLATAAGGDRQAVSPYSVTRASSVQDAGELLKSRQFAVVLVSLDLQPAPQAAVRLADFALDLQVPVVLVTRSLRWLPATSSHLRLLPWVSPEAELPALASALDDALAASSLLRSDDDGERKSLGF